MDTVKEIEGKVSGLTGEELRRFRDWFSRFDAQAWDDQLEKDVSAGKLDEFADQAVEELKSGQTTKL